MQECGYPKYRRDCDYLQHSAFGIVSMTNHCHADIQFNHTLTHAVLLN